MADHAPHQAPSGLGPDGSVSTGAGALSDMETALIAAISMLNAPARIDERGCGRDYSLPLDVTIAVPDKKRFEAGIHELAATTRADFLASPASVYMRAISYAAKHPFWTNAPFTGCQWIMDGCPGLTIIAQPSETPKDMGK